MRRVLSPVVFPYVLALLAGLLDAPARADRELVVDKLNKKIDNFTLPDAAGRDVSLYDLKDKKVVVIVFLSFDCPVSNSYAPSLAELARSYGARQVAFLAVNSSDDGDSAQLAKRAAEFKLPFPVLKDVHFRAADAFKADTVPSAFVLDHNFVLRYRGRIDDGYVARLKRNARVSRFDLRQALEDLLAGKPVAEPATRPIGCPIQRELTARGSGPVTYHHDVLPILQTNCQGCHRPGAVGPFSLLTYKQAVTWANDIKEYTQEHKMPPWKPVEGLAFHDERKLSERDIRTLAAWVDGGVPEGDPREAPTPRQFFEGWQLGRPDLVLTVPEEMTVGASGPDLFRCFVLPTNLAEDKYVTAVELRPGNNRIVHHSLNFFDTTGKARELEKKERQRKDSGQDQGPGYSVAMGIGFTPAKPDTLGGLGGWAPGQMARHLPEGYGYLLPRGADVILQVHYHRNGRVEKDRTSIGLYFAKNGNVKRWKGMVLPGRFLAIPPNDSHYRVEGGLEVLQEATLYSVMPHMHMLGKQIKVTVTPPGGKPLTLVAIKDWDYNWQETYFLKEPIAIKPGTRVAVVAFFDNSRKNPNNPFSPPRWVKFGEHTHDEMCYVFLGATADTPGRIQVRQDSGGGKRKDDKSAGTPKP